MTFVELIEKFKRENNNCGELVESWYKDYIYCYLSDKERYCLLKGFAWGLYSAGYITFENNIDIIDDLFTRFIDYKEW